nr:MAG TPA: hypothetical protein [Caudoviricetes sp.]DAI54805.1 MAG TPA: hypothetical protein [Caudoviricetes sp.]
MVLITINVELVEWSNLRRLICRNENFASVRNLTGLRQETFRLLSGVKIWKITKRTEKKRMIF